MHPSPLALFAALCLSACASTPSPAPVSISPVLYADAPAAASLAASPTAAPSAPTPAAAQLGPMATAVSNAHVPLAAGLASQVGRFVERADAWEVEVTAGERPFKWVVAKRPRHPLSLVSIVEDGRTIEPLAGAILAGANGVDPNPPRVQRMHASGGTLVVEYQSGMRLELTPLGRALRVQAAGGLPVRTQAQLDVSQGGVRGDVASTRILYVPFFDIAGVAALKLRSGAVRYLTTWFDPARSNATLIVGHQPGLAAPGGELHYGQLARYKPLTDGTRLPFQERIWISYTADLESALPSLDRAPSGGVERAADLFFLSLNEPDFPAAAEALAAIAAQGVGWGEYGFAMWMKQWQRDGYDVGYPSAVMPPNPAWGGLDGLLAVRAVAAKAGFLFGLHHNWLFNGERIEGESMLDSDGSPVTSDAGGHYLKLRKSVELVDAVEGEFHQVFDTQGTYSDSIGASLPRADSDATVAGAGSIAAQLELLGQVIARLKAIHGAPTASEGSLGFGHVIWSGAFDMFHGSLYWQTQPTSLERAGRFADLVPAFAWGRLHALSVRGGVGIPLRFMHAAGTDQPGYSARDRDEQRTLSLVYGSTGFHWWYRLSVPGDVARDWWSGAPLTAWLAEPGRAAPTIRYIDASGKAHTLDAWLAAGKSLMRGDVRMRLEWPGGERILANLTEAVWRVDGIAIAPMGYHARIADVEGGIVMGDKGVLEFVRAPDFVFVDGRGQRVGRAGMATDGAVGARLEEGAWRVFPLQEYTLNLPALDAPERVAFTRLTLEPELIGAGPVTVEWFDADGLALLTETRGDVPLTLTRKRFDELGAASVRVRAK